MTKTKVLMTVIGKILLCLLFIILFVLAFITIYHLTSYLLGTSTSSLLEFDMKGWMNYVPMGAFIVTPLLMYALFERKKGWVIGIKQPKAVFLTIQGLIAGILLITATSVIIWALGDGDWDKATWSKNMLQAMINGLVFFIFVSLSEEILTRGYIQGLLRYHYGAKVAIVISSILFAFMHSFNQGIYDSPWPLINLFLTGIILAVARELTGGVWLPIGLHIAWNYFQGYIYGFKVSGTAQNFSMFEINLNGPDVITGGSFGAEGSMISSIILIIGIVSILIIYKRKKAVFIQSLS